MATWAAAQRMGGLYGNVSAPKCPPGDAAAGTSSAPVCHCSICHRRMTGNTIRTYTYYPCRTIPACPATTPPTPITAPSPSAKEIMATALAWFFTERVFGPDRAAMLTTQLPASAAGQAERRDRQTAAIRRKIARLDHNRGPHHKIM